jgi:hypothetical protein
MGLMQLIPPNLMLLRGGTNSVASNLIPQEATP